MVEDHARVAANLQQALLRQGYVVEVSGSGAEALDIALTQPFDVLIIDLMLPGLSGSEIITTLRARGTTVRILVVTARDAIDDRLRELNAGADDYLVKPFAIAEVVARVGALARRAREQNDRRLRLADLELDLITRRATRAGRPIDLAPREFELLAYLMSQNGRIVSREMLGREVWNQIERGTPLDNVIDVHVGRLRRKIDLPSEHALIHTVRGLGFRAALE